MNKLVALALAVPAFAMASAAQAVVVYTPGMIQFQVFGDGTTGTDPVSATIGTGGLSASDTALYKFIIGPAGGNLIGLGSGSVSTSFSVGSSNGLVFTSVTFNNGVDPAFVIPVVNGLGNGNNIPIYSGVINTLSLDYTVTGVNASYGGNLTFTPLAPLPEPASWMMLIAGFAGVGGVMRRRVQKSQVHFAV